MKTMSGAVELACSIENPWKCAACIPDGSNNVGCFSVKETKILGTGTGGTCCAYFLCPSTQNFSYTMTNLATTTISIGTYWDQPSSIAAIANAYMSYRPVSAGIRATYVGNTQTDGGVLVIGQLAPSFKLGDLHTADVNTLCNLATDYMQIPLRNGGSVTWRPPNAMTAATWNTVQNAAQVTTVSNINQGIIFAVVFGASAATSSLVQIEAVVNLEGTYHQQTFIPGGIDSSAQNRPIEAGWFEKAHAIYNRVRAFAPVIGSVLSATGNPTLSVLGTMANGLPRIATLAQSSKAFR